MKNDITVSVCMITYNHELYIKQAIEGVLMQKTNFDYELIIGEDCSTDSTRMICEEYMVSNPGIQLLPSEFNHGILPNFIRTLQACTGKYIALCEGDDYWIDPLKLQKQVDFLEMNPEFVMSFHSANMVYETILSTNSAIPPPPRNVLTMVDLLKNHYIITNSLLFLRSALPQPFPEWLFQSSIGDIPLEILIAEKGLTYYHDESMSIYRKHSASITHNKKHRKSGRKTFLFVYKNLNRDFKYKYWQYFTVKLIKTRLGYIKDLLGINESLK